MTGLTVRERYDAGLPARDSVEAARYREYRACERTPRPSRLACRIAAALAVIGLSLLTLTGCSYPFPNACEGHGGIRALISGIYYCRDGSDIGAGWLLFHPHDPRAAQS